MLFCLILLQTKVSFFIELSLPRVIVVTTLLYNIRIMQDGEVRV